MKITAMIQARMSSRRFPGKVLAPFRGKPLIVHVLTCVERVIPRERIVIATSDHDSDIPLAIYLKTLGYGVYRGSLQNVFERFRRCVTEYPCDFILRITADSPLLNHTILQAVIHHANTLNSDLVTTVFPRTFPRGQNAELINVKTFQAILPQQLTSEDREHLTQFYYTHADRFRITNVHSLDPLFAETHLAVDTVEDLRRLEELSEDEIRTFSCRDVVSRG